MIKLYVDKNKCDKCGTCVAVCPDVFVFDDYGYAAISEEYRGSSPYVGEIPDALRECAREAADHCSMYAIIIEK